MKHAAPTNEAEKRAAFKAALKERLDNATVPVFVADEPVERIYTIPAGYDKLSTDRLIDTLIRNHQYSLDSARYVVEMLAGREPQPSYVSFQIVETLEPVAKTQQPTGWIESKTKAVPHEARPEFKFKQPVSTDPVLAAQQFLEPMTIPANYAEIPEAALFQELTAGLGYHVQTAQWILDILHNRVLPTPAERELATPDGTLVAAGSLYVAPTVKPAQPTGWIESKTAAVPHEGRAEFEVAPKPTAEPQPDVAPTPITHVIPSNYSKLSESALFHSLINEIGTYSVETAQQAIDILFGRIAPANTTLVTVDGFEVTAGAMKAEKQPKAALSTEWVKPTINDQRPEDKPEEAIKRVQFKSELAQKAAAVPAAPLPERVPSVVVAEVPMNFAELAPVTLHSILVYEQGLTREHADDVVRMLNGKDQITDASFTITLAKALKEPTPVVRSETLREISILLPHNFSLLRSTEQYVWLMKESGNVLTHDEANDVIDILRGRKPVTRTHFEISFDDAPPALEVVDEVQADPAPPLDIWLPATFSGLKKSHKLMFLSEQFPVDQAWDIIAVLDGKLAPSGALYNIHIEASEIEEAAAAKPAVSISVPSGFASMRPQEQYIYLTRTALLTPDLANDALAALNGKQQSGDVLFEFEVDE